MIVKCTNCGCVYDEEAYRLKGWEEGTGSCPDCGSPEYKILPKPYRPRYIG